MSKFVGQKCPLIEENKACCKDLLNEVIVNQRNCCETLVENDAQQTTLLEKILLEQKKCCETTTSAEDSHTILLEKIDANIGNCCDDSVCSKLKKIGIETTKIDEIKQCSDFLKERLNELRSLPRIIGNCDENEPSVCSLLKNIDVRVQESLELLKECSFKLVCDNIATILLNMTSLQGLLGNPGINNTISGLILMLKDVVQQIQQKTNDIQIKIDAIASEQSVCFAALKSADVNHTNDLKDLQAQNARELELLAGISNTLGNCCAESMCEKLCQIKEETNSLAEIKTCFDKIKASVTALEGLPEQIGVCGKDTLCSLSTQIKDQLTNALSLLGKCDLGVLCEKINKIFADLEKLVLMTGTPAPNTTIAGAVVTLQNMLNQMNDAIQAIVLSNKDILNALSKCAMDQQKLCDIMSCCTNLTKTSESILAKLSVWDNWFFNFSGKVEQLCSKLDTVTNQLTNTNDKINSLANGVAALTSTVNGVMAETKAIESKVCALDVKVDHITSQQDQDSACLSQIKSDLAAFKAKIGAQQSAAAATLNNIQNQLRDLAVQLAECCCQKSCGTACEAPCAPAEPAECAQGCGSSCCGFGMRPSGLEVHKNVTRVSHTPEGIRIAFLLTIANTSTTQTFSNVQLKDPIACVGQNPQTNSATTLFNTEICFVERLQQCQLPQLNYAPTTYLTSNWQLNSQFSINPTDPLTPRSINIFNDAGLLTLGPGDMLMLTFAILVKNCGLKCLTNVLTVCGESPEGITFPQFTICEKIDTSGNGCSDNSCLSGRCSK